MTAYFVTVPITLTEEQRNTADRAGWRVAADLHSDVADAAVPQTTLEVRQDSPEEAASVVAHAFGFTPEEVRVEER